ncbi:phospholipase D-like domain-containing protein [Deinococcus sp. JMULE3]|uniref:phospholipase D-like domain-containing protein n=1 Tax=Deinococcus sp. JMULE3 TaxID=2518341 RepID=UPI0015764D32|nr:phospholipase D-like domain-containing protein [Deinococcus sp. JMULE3]NTY02182.1 phospholipase [Deinococcus sp. JMULE3]
MRAALLILALLLPAGAHAARLPLFLGPAARPTTPAPQVCAAPVAPLERVLWDLDRARGGPDLSCGNEVLGYVRTPRDLDAPQDAYQTLAQEMQAARAEVLLTTMEWESDPARPGGTFVQAARDLYRRVQADPAAYPQGMTVRVLLGNYPQLSDPAGSAQVLGLARALREADVPLHDPRVGWTLTLLNYAYLPHSHVKLHVIDGQDLTVSGYNFTGWHLPLGDAGGLALHDTGLRVRGPAAQAGVAAFDDLWRHSDELRCPEALLPAEVASRCALEPAQAPSHPALAARAVGTGPDRAFMLYRRTAGEDHADRAHLALIGAARRSIDLMQSDFSPGLDCWFGYLNPDPCTVDRMPVYFPALLAAMQRGVHVRLLVVEYGFGKPANRTGVALMRRELRRLGLEDRFEARYTTFRMHSKIMTVDHALVVVGSMNFHFSAWGSAGLAESALATGNAAAIREQDRTFEQAWTTSSVPVPAEPWLSRITPGQP